MADLARARFYPGPGVERCGDPWGCDQWVFPRMSIVDDTKQIIIHIPMVALSLLVSKNLVGFSDLSQILRYNV